MNQTKEGRQEPNHTPPGQGTPCQPPPTGTTTTPYGGYPLPTNLNPTDMHYALATPLHPIYIPPDL